MDEKDKKFYIPVIVLASLLMLSIIAIIFISAIKPKSAYDIAVKNGFSGSEQEWIQSLKGGSGEAGESGEIGKTIEEITAEHLNNKLQNVDTENIKTVYGRFCDAGITATQLKRLTKRYLYSYKDNKIVVIDDAGYVVYDTGSYEKDTLLLSGNDLYRFTSSNRLSENYSNYLIGGSATVLNIKTGLDVGEVSSINTVNLKRDTGDADDIMIRTDNDGTTLNINDRTESVISHYGDTGILNIIECNMSSYHEYGAVGFAEIKKGRIVIEPSSDIKAIHIDSKKENDISLNLFDSVTIADNGVKKLPEIITRDNISITEPTLVVKIENLAENSFENVYVYPYTEDSVQTGTTEKTTVQNPDVSSALGLKILDNNEKAGEKALSATELEFQIETYATCAKTAEFMEINKNDSMLYSYVARIGKVGYESLPDAISSANDNEIIVVLKDIEISDWVTINKQGVCFTVDVAGKTVERKDGSLFDIYSKVIFKDSKGTGKISAKGRVFYCNAGADCTLLSGNIYNSDGSCINVYGEYASPDERTPVFTMNGGNIVCEQCFYVESQKYGAKLIINGGTVKANDLAISAFNNKNSSVEIRINGGKLSGKGDYAVTINGNYGGAVVDITGGEITCENGCAVYMPGQNSYSITGGKFTGREALVVKGGTWDITGGEFIAVGEENSPESPENSNYAPTGDSLYIEDNYGKENTVHNITMNISGATFTSLNGYAVSARFKNDSQYKEPAIINIGENVELNSADSKKKICLANGFSGAVNGVDSGDMEIK